MMILKLQNAAQRRFVLVECYLVKLLHTLGDFLERPLRFWIIHE